MAFAHQNYSFLTAFLGSPTYNCLVRLLGVKFEGRALLLPHRMYEYSYITIAENTIVDSSQITGHYAIYGDITVGHCRLSGVMHEGTYAANAMIAAGESDPWRAFVGSYQPHAKNTIDIKPFEDEGATMHVIDFSTFDATSGNGNVGSDHAATHSKTSTDDDVEAADGRSITKNQLPTDMAVLGYDDVSSIAEKYHSHLNKMSDKLHVFINFIKLHRIKNMSYLWTLIVPDLFLHTLFIKTNFLSFSLDQTR